jgi:transposase
MGFKTANRSDLDSISILDQLPSNDKCRFIVDIVSRLDLSSLYACYSSQGGDAYDPAILLATWFYAYSLGITSSRKIEELCRVDIRFIYLSANLGPDHCGLNRFRQRNVVLMVEFFVQIVHLLKEAGVSDFNEINIDGTKLSASASRKKSKSSDELSRKLAQVRQQIEAYMRQCDATETEDTEEELEDVQKKLAQLQDQEQTLLKRQSQLEARKEELKAEHRKDHQINLTDPDARFMPKGDGPCYNAQAAVDSETMLIVANDVTTDPNDQNQFSNMHQRTEDNLGSDPHRKENGDSGYHSLEQLENIEKNQIDAIIADPTPQNRSNRCTPTPAETILKSERKVERSDFTYHPDEDYYECPQGKRLEPAGTFNNSKSKGTIYQSPSCEGCSLKELCLSKKNTSGIKRIYRDEREELAENMHQKLQTPEAKQRLKTRATTVEPVFGNIKHNMGIRRFCLRGLEKVKGEFNLICIAHNLNILYNICGGLLYQLLFAIYCQFCAILTMSKTKRKLIYNMASRPTYARPAG